jgi:hypothetical protein
MCAYKTNVSFVGRRVWTLSGLNSPLPAKNQRGATVQSATRAYGERTCGNSRRPFSSSGAFFDLVNAFSFCTFGQRSIGSCYLYILFSISCPDVCAHLSINIAVVTGAGVKSIGADAGDFSQCQFSIIISI